MWLDRPLSPKKISSRDFLVVFNSNPQIYPSLGVLTTTPLTPPLFLPFRTPARSTGAFLVLLPTMLLCFHAAALQPHLRGTRVAAAVAHTAFSMVGCLRAIPPRVGSLLGSLRSLAHPAASWTPRPPRGWATGFSRPNRVVWKIPCL